MEFTQLAIDYYHKLINFCRKRESAKILAEEEFKNSIDSADLLERQIKAYKLDMEIQMENETLKSDNWKKF